MSVALINEWAPIVLIWALVLAVALAYYASGFNDDDD